LIGTYLIQLSYENKHLETLSFSVVSQNVPDWVKNTAKWWADDQIPESEFVKLIQYLVKKGIIRI